MTLSPWCLRPIVLGEAQAARRFRTVEGLWHTSARERPGSMTRFSRERGLLSSAAIDAVIAGAPVDLIDFQRVAPKSRSPSVRLRAIASILASSVSPPDRRGRVGPSECRIRVRMMRVEQVSSCAPIS